MTKNAAPAANPLRRRKNKVASVTIKPLVKRKIAAPTQEWTAKDKALAVRSQTAVGPHTLFYRSVP